MRRVRFVVATILTGVLLVAAIGSASAQGPVKRATLTTKKDLNKKKGTAVIKATVSTRGDLKLRGKKVKAVAKSATSAGVVKLKVKPTGKTKKKLRKKGKVKVKVFLNFTPTNADPNDPYDPYDPYNPNDTQVKKKLKFKLKLQPKKSGGKN